MGFEVDGRAQVSMNLLDTEATPIRAAFAAVEREAKRRGVAIARSEIVGLVPERALRDVTAAAIKLHDPESYALEARIRDAERSAGGDSR
jgi:glutamate formiminotransferase